MLTLAKERKPDRIAVLDDDIKFIRMVERMLRSEDIDIEPVTTPDIAEAVRVVAGAGCQAALVDLYMYGDPQGLGFVEALRQNSATGELPVIVTSAAHRELGRRVNFLVDHHCSVLLKPFSMDDLLSRIDSAVTAPVTADAPRRFLLPRERLHLGHSVAGS